MYITRLLILITLVISLSGCGYNLPTGYVKGLPVGILFFGRAWSEPTLLRIAYAYEQATQHRTSPKLPSRLGLRDLV